MDRRRALAGVLIAAAFLTAASDAADLPIAEARWLAPGTLIEGLTRQPPECLRMPRDPKARLSVATGRAAFRAPLLLGGQAARAGLSCAACHRNGRDNPAFSFPGLSGAPGTADVTSSLMSSHRGDSAVNPKPIPDLAALGTVSRAKTGGELERFIRGLIVEEFDGPEPSEAVLRGLADYVRAMDLKACPPSASRLTLDGLLVEAGEAADVAGAAAEAGDRETMRLLVAAARSALGRIDERFQVAGLESVRDILADADAELRAVREMPAADAAPALAAWKQRWMPRLAALEAMEDRSLFSPAMLRRRLSR